MVFGVRRTWIGVEELDPILHDDEYVPVAPDEVAEGDVVVYSRSETYTHVGLVLRVDVSIENAQRRITVLSKWGADGEYVHALDDVPELYGGHVVFHTERKTAR
jgi:hypothetical protein